MRFQRQIMLFVLALIFNACATFKPQYADENNRKSFPNDKEIVHSFFLIGDGGNSPLGTKSPALQDLQKHLEQASKNSTVLFLGDNIYPAGLPKKNHAQREFAEHQLNVQTSSVENFKGRSIFIPGNHDWYSNGLNGLKRQEKYIEDKIGKNTFLPENGCPIEKIDIEDDIVLIVIDSQWYLENWDRHPTINDDCEIKTRAMFFDEYESLIKKARGKTTIVALHHPMFSNGPHGGQFGVKQHMSPIPILGTLASLIRKTGGVTTTDLQNSNYTTFQKRIVTLSQENDGVIFVSGHDHNLQYIIEDNLPQIISGSGSKVNPTRNVGGGQFSYGAPGFARLDVFKDGSTFVRFYKAGEKETVFNTEVTSIKDEGKDNAYDSTFPERINTSVYTKEETDKKKSYKRVWGERYRKYYSTDIEVPTVNLDTLYGGLTPTRKGGGHQSKSLRLEDKEGREFVMRALRKNAVQYLQAVAFKEQYIMGQFNDTYAEGLLLDIFTGAHPYAPFTIGKLSEAVGVFHTNPILVYVPKQKALGDFNFDFGDELYMIEERAADDHGDKASFGYSNKLISTHDMLRELRQDEDNIIDEKAYIRARLFDMLIGDWDRHEDQWRWAKFKENKKTIYRPMPRDRDQAYSVMADGNLLNVATKIVPALRLMRSYDEELKSPKWFNLEPYPLDVALIEDSGKDIWDAEVRHLMNNLTDDVIEEAFLRFPKEVQGETTERIKQKLKGRRTNLQQISDAYFEEVNKYVVIKGTDKDDWFDIVRKGSTTHVTGYRIQQDEKGEVFHDRVYDSTTKEIWIYGLDDKDVFEVRGKGTELIQLRLIGGQNNDTYNILNGNKVKTYDYRSKSNTFITSKGSKKLTDDYETNIYDYKKPKYDANQFMPTLGANPDDGFKIGVSNTYTINGFERNPFTARHHFSAQYYFATQGFELNYSGEFANVIGKGNLGIDAYFTSPNYSINFFGFGNETINLNAEDEDNFDLDYNRVKLSTLKVAPYLNWIGSQGSNVKLGMHYSVIEVEETQGRFINTFFDLENEDNENTFLGGEFSYSYENKDSNAFPTLGMAVDFTAGFTSNLDESNSFGYIIPSIEFDHKLSANGQLVFATKFKGHLTLGDDFEFYQAASLGASDGLRGYRNQRFTGKSAFYNSTDIRLNLRKYRTGFLPFNFGIYGGMDNGRVWVDGQDSDSWNNSIGGGIFFNGANKLVGNISAFNSDDGMRLAFRLGFGF